MSDLIRTDTVFGKRVNIVGNISADLVLESLGKVYIKSRNKALTLEELITSLVNQDPNTSTSKVKVVEGIEDLDTSEFKDGTFIFDKLSNILYLYIDEELLELINVAPEGTGYVKRTGDTMTGRLTIYVNNGPPLYVNSALLVENLNAEYLNGERADSFTRRNKDEKIEGKWTFKRPTTFESNTLFLKDIVTHGSIGSPSFSTGFGGYGWRMDADTNTLTVDNLVVRKLMQVYELVVNKISATNGSLWVTNAGKVALALKLEIKENSFFDSAEADRFCAGLPSGYTFIKLTTTYETLESEAFSTPSGENIIIKLNCPSTTTLSNAKLVIRRNNKESCVGSKFDSDNDNRYHLYSLFSSDFKFKCVFPIITRLAYRDYINSPEDFNIKNRISYIEPYYKYFAKGDFYLVNFDSDSLPVFKAGDIIRCLKWTYGGIKYYDGVICNYVDNLYVILLAPSILDIKTTVSYDSSLEPLCTVQNESINLDLYKSTVRTPKPKDGETLDILGLIEKDDSIVLMGNLWDSQRLNAVYITSTDNGAPFMDVLSGINRPDYSVIYYVPIFLTIKLYASPAPSITGFTNAIDIPYTGDYYVLDSEVTQCDYTYFSYTSNGVTGKYLAKGKSMPLGATLIHYLSSSPNKDCLLGKSEENFNILLEDGGRILLEDYVGTERFEGDYFLLLEEGLDKLTIASTRTTKARFGNLDSVQDELFPIDKLPYGYGLYGQNVFLTGEFYLNNGQSVADIGRDAIAFAVASAKAQNDARYLLEQDLKRADMLLKNNTYSKNLLYTAGMYINNNALMVLWANLLMIVTRQDEFTGTPTAIFENGKISGKFIQAYDIHSAWHSDLTTKLVALVLLTSSGTKYYQEVLVYPKLDENDLLMKDSNNKLLYYCDELPSLTLTEDDVYESYTEFGWHLKALGDGYLAQRNISWTANGKLAIKGDLTIEGNNGIHIINSSGYNTFNITGRSISDLSSWTNSSQSSRVVFEGSYNSLTSTTLSGDVYSVNNSVYTTISNVNCGIVRSVVINSSNATLRISGVWNFPTVTRTTANTSLYIVLNFADSSQLIYILEPEESLNYNIGSTTLTSFDICIPNITNNEGLNGYISYQSMNLSSEIGTNFISYITNSSNAFWFGLDGLKVASIGAHGLVIDSGGVALINKDSNETTFSSLANRLASINSISKYSRYDIFKALDNTLQVDIFSDLHTRMDGNTMQYLGWDANENEGTSVMGVSSQGQASLLIHYVYFNPIRRKVIIVRPVEGKSMILLLYAGDDSRIGSIKNIVIQPGYSGEISIAAYDGRIYSRNDDSDFRTYLNGDSFSNSTCWRLPDYTNALSIMYLGKLTVDNNLLNIFRIIT